MGITGCKPEGGTTGTSSKKCVPAPWVEELHQGTYTNHAPSVFECQPHVRKYSDFTQKLFVPPQLVQGSPHFGPDEEQYVEIEQALHGPERTIMVQGYPGSGVTHLLYHILTESFRSLVEYGTPRYGMMAGVTSLIYIKNGKETLETTVKHGLDGHIVSHREEDVWQHFISSPKEAALVVDSLDKISHQPQLVMDILAEISTNKRTILLGCTPNHPLATTILSHRHVKLVTIDGFHPSSMLSYIDQCFKLCKYEQEDVLKKLLDVVRKRERRLQVFLREPMTLSMFCVLFLEGRCGLDDLGSITRGDIYTNIEKLILEHQDIEADEKSMEQYQQFAFNCVVQHCTFYPDASNLYKQGIDDELVPQFYRTGNSNFAVYAAAKHVHGMDEGRQHDMLMYLAAKPDLIYLLNAVLELYEADETRLVAVVNQQLAVLPDFPIPCEDCQKLQEQKLELRQANLTEVGDKASPPSLKPCVTCWEQYADTQHGMKLIALSHSTISSSRSGEHNLVRYEVFSKTIHPLLPERKSGLGLFFPHFRYDNKVHVNYRERPDGTVVISATHPYDLHEIDLFDHIKIDRPLHTLVLNVACIGGIYGDQDNFGYVDAWRRLVDENMVHRIKFKPPGGVLEIPGVWGDDMPSPSEDTYEQLYGMGCRAIRMEDPPAYKSHLIWNKWIIVTDEKYTYLVPEVFPLLEVLEHINRSKLQLKQIEADRHELAKDRQLVQALAKKYSRVVLASTDEDQADGRLYLSGKKQVHSYNEEGLLYIFHQMGRYFPEWVRVEQLEQEGEQALQVFTSHVLDMVTTDALSLYTHRRRWTTLWLHTNLSGEIHPDEYKAASAGDWTKALRYVTKCGVDLQGTMLYIDLGSPPQDLSEYTSNDHGRVNLKRYKETSAGLVKYLPSLISLLMDKGVPLLVIYYGAVKVQDLRSLILNLQQGWKVSVSDGYEGSKLHKGDKELLVSLKSPQILLESEREEEQEEKEQVEQLIAGVGLCVDTTYEVYDPYNVY